MVPNSTTMASYGSGSHYFCEVDFNKYEMKSNHYFFVNDLNLQVGVNLLSLHRHMLFFL